MNSDTTTTAGDTEQALRRELAMVQARLTDAEDTLRAIRNGEIDALLVTGPAGAQVYTLQSAEQPYRILIEQMQEGAVTLALDGTILYCNLRFSHMLGLEDQKVITTNIEMFVSELDRPQFAELLDAAKTGSARGEISMIAGSGRMPTYVTLNALPGQIAGALCLIVTDLTEQESMRRNQAMIEGLNKRLRRAMTETHHRIKNSLQIMSALVDLRVMDCGEFIPKAAIGELTRQVRVLATVHDLLTEQSKVSVDGDTVPAGELLGKLLSMLEEIAVSRKFQYKIDDVQLAGRQPIALALVLNELVLNALKHGEGPVEISFNADDNAATLEVRDSGEGLPAGFEPSIQGGTGLTLISNLVSWDLQGTLSYRNRTDGSGTCVTVRFPTAAPPLLDPVAWLMRSMRPGRPGFTDRF